MTTAATHIHICNSVTRLILNRNANNCCCIAKASFSSSNKGTHNSRRVSFKTYLVVCYLSWTPMAYDVLPDNIFGFSIFTNRTLIHWHPRTNNHTHTPTPTQRINKRTYRSSGSSSSSSNTQKPPYVSELFTCTQKKNRRNNEKEKIDDFPYGLELESPHILSFKS